VADLLNEYVTIVRQSVPKDGTYRVWRIKLEE